METVNVQDELEAIVRDARQLEDRAAHLAQVLVEVADPSGPASQVRGSVDNLVSYASNTKSAAATALGLFVAG